ncbi:MAG: LdpA C-terminal domain-containing domain [Candidatus Gastranaerophilaceae bacterium]
METLKERFEKGNLTKVIMGLGNTFVEQITALGAICSLAKADIFDLTPDKKVFDAIKRGILSQGLNPNDYLYCVSFSFGEDVHGTKADINEEKCNCCGKCEKLCPYGAISDCKVSKEKCIGCGKCTVGNECGAINYYKEIKNPIEELKKLSEYKIDMVELHVNGFDKKSILEEVKKIKNAFPNIMIGLCMTYEKRDLTEVKEIIRETEKIIFPQKLIFQADGKAMSGINNDINSSLKSVKFAKELAGENAYIILSGGCNERTKELVKSENAKISGIGYGSYIRILTAPFVQNSEFWCNIGIIEEAVERLNFFGKA